MRRIPARFAIRALVCAVFAASIALLDSKRSSAMPEVPTSAEAGIKAE